MKRCKINYEVSPFSPDWKEAVITARNDRNGRWQGSDVLFDGEGKELGVATYTIQTSGNRQIQLTVVGPARVWGALYTDHMQTNGGTIRKVKTVVRKQTVLVDV